MTENTDTTRQQSYTRLLDVEPPQFAPQYRVVVLLGVAIILGGISSQVFGVGLGLALVMAVSIGIIGWVLPSEYAFVSGHLAVSIVLPPNPNLLVLTLIEVSLWMLLVLESETTQLAARLGIFGCGIVSLLSVLGWTLLYQEPSLWNASFVIVSITAALLYGIHRYEVVQVRLAEESDT